MAAGRHFTDYLNKVSGLETKSAQTASVNWLPVSARGGMSVSSQIKQNARRGGYVRLIYAAKQNGVQGFENADGEFVKASKSDR